MKTDLNSLGHVVTGEGVKPDLEKVKAIKNFPIPKNTTGVKSFLGLAGYYRKFVPCEGWQLWRLLPWLDFEERRGRSLTGFPFPFPF